ncbi:transglutaminase family protein [Siculibacillus lacustris]|uniref:Transglutaminase family protein n=1 Tax=Siculibacillus lacustris TaxID=1549641 RepID=A0A4Q9VUW3_9HYPH|nr:transglutaminase family protein [Siculibacillus lacustris]TBW40015.1 transglutaminase family protein [Siculibacillus lacustris]
MRYDISHVTVYDWGVPVPFADCRVRLTPVERPRQHVLTARLVLEPVAALAVDGLDFFGNHVLRTAFRVPHRRLTIRSTATVVVEPPPSLEPDPTPVWTAIREATARSRGLLPSDPVQFLFPSRRIALAPAVTAWTAESFPEGRTILAGALDLTRRIWEDFTYAPGETDVGTPLLDAFTARHGVCQDFAHVMIAGLRGLGLPAAYVGGYLRTVPPPGRERLEGADAMHAWVEVWCGATLGWLGFDPTNGIVAAEDHIVVAVGRDYSDVSPVSGVLVTTGAQGLSVAVDVVESPDPDAAEAPPQPVTTTGEPTGTRR